MAKKLFFIFFLVLFGILMLIFFFPEIPPPEFQKTELTAEEKILNELNLEQKIGQLFIIGFEGKKLNPEIEKLLKTFHPGGVLLLSRNIENPEQLKSLIKGLQEIALSDTGLPLFVAVDQEGGPISRIECGEISPQSEIKNENQAYQIGLKRAKELKELGINLNLAPLLDVTQSGDFLEERSFQKDPEVIGKLAKALISGQKAAGILTAIKHFPGYARISFNPEEKLAIQSEIPEISQFQKAMESSPEMVMTSNVIYQKIDKNLPFTFSFSGLQFLKEKLGEEILVVSDDLAQNSLLTIFSLKEIVTLPVKAGVDILIFSGWRLPVAQGLLTFQEAAKKGEVSEKRINQSVLRIIKLKEKLVK